MGHGRHALGRNERTDVVSGFDQTNGLVDGVDGEDKGAMESAEPDSVFEDAMRSIDDSTPDDGDPSVTAYSEEGKP